MSLLKETIKSFPSVAPGSPVFELLPGRFIRQRIDSTTEHGSDASLATAHARVVAPRVARGRTQQAKLPLLGSLRPTLTSIPSLEEDFFFFFARPRVAAASWEPGKEIGQGDGDWQLFSAWCKSAHATPSSSTLLRCGTLC